MAGVVHAPPGRAGRLWLQRRLATAHQGADLLDHKLRVLRTERQRLALQEERTLAAWQEASREADTWLLRGVLLGGERAVRLTADQAPAAVEVEWEQSMGVRHPARATCVVPDPVPGAPPAANAAMVTARQCYRRALEAAVEHAAVEEAVRVVEAEEQATRRRLRALEHRWIPRLEQGLAEVLFTLEEEEHTDGVRMRWAAGRQARPDPDGAGAGTS